MLFRSCLLFGLLACGCGRIGFDPQVDAGTGGETDADTEPVRVLVIRGGSGTFANAAIDGDLQGVDIFDTSSDLGWGRLGELWSAQGAVITQRLEGPVTAPGPADLSGLDDFDLVVFGSNNATYGAAVADEVEAYVRAGGAALFVADGSFGQSLPAPSNSDQAFLTRFDLVANQDFFGGVVQRDEAEWLVASHPVLLGVTAFNAAGVSSVTVVDVIPDITPLMLVAETGSVRRNDMDPGTVEAPTSDDGALVVATVGAGRIAAFYDRDTWFNPGRPSAIDQLDNARLAANLFAWLIDR